MNPVILSAPHVRAEFRSNQARGRVLYQASGVVARAVRALYTSEGHR